MFLSLPTSAWILIAVGATLFNLVGMQWIIQIPEYRRKQFWMPVIGIVCVGSRSLVQSHTLAETLFLYAALIVGFPLALAPVRGQITRDYYRWLKDPTTKPSKASMTWVVTSMMIMLVVIIAVRAMGTKGGA
ncbi:hypothetical protein GCM10027176_21590 [Actinoallomurus bryophytorum]|uniref:Uncharacterized protein n=1 Tax=Actinoallomurus bryophytorum TaxID=1490222 RepID=A0A543CKE3_9ACTN|nr:hypothetical protein [Actinoallomurus bryophytorum]TQL97572.1 hypothetical protein FB559_3166 [Actinoallomurus bryophytorum]